MNSSDSSKVLLLGFLKNCVGSNDRELTVSLVTEARMCMAAEGKSRNPPPLMEWWYKRSGLWRF